MKKFDIRVSRGGVVFGTILFSTIIGFGYLLLEVSKSTTPPIIQSDMGRRSLPINTSDVLNNQEGDVMGMPSAKPGVYSSYYADVLSRVPADARVVLFFHAVHCASCREADEAIAAADNIPSNLYILKVDFDRELELRRMYGVARQHTFVEVDSLGRKKQKWIGGRNLDAVLSKL